VLSGVGATVTVIPEVLAVLVLYIIGVPCVEELGQ